MDSSVCCCCSCYSAGVVVGIDDHAAADGVDFDDAAVEDAGAAAMAPNFYCY